MSNSPHLPRQGIVPGNFRGVLRNQMKAVTNAAVDELSKFSFGNIDGRFANNLPGRVQELSDPLGNEYHRVGFHTMGDLSVAAP